MSIKKLTMMMTVALLAAISQPTRADVVGLICIEAPPQTDVVVPIAFTARSEGTYTVTGTTGTALQISGGLITDVFAGKFYAKMVDGDSAGEWSTINSNTATDLELANTDLLSDVSVGDKFEVFRHTTLGTLLPDELAGASFIKSPTQLDLRTQILVPDDVSVATNKSAKATYFFQERNFIGNTLLNQWAIVGPPGNRDDDVLPPGSYVILRNTDTTKTLTVYVSGVVDCHKLAQPIPINANANDVPLSMGKPVPRTLAGLNLVNPATGDGPFKVSTSVLDIKDQLLVFLNRDENTNAPKTGTNRSADITFFYLYGNDIIPPNDFKSEWRRVGPPLNENDFEVPVDATLVIRKVGMPPMPVLWCYISPF